MCPPGELYQHRYRLFRTLPFYWIQDNQPARFVLDCRPDHNSVLFAWFEHTGRQGDLERLHRFLEEVTPTAYREYERTGEYFCYDIETYEYCPHVHRHTRHSRNSA